MTASTALPLNGGGRRNGHTSAAHESAAESPAIKLVTTTAKPEANPEVETELEAARRDQGTPWSWSNPELQDAIVYPTSRAVAVYWGNSGDLVIRQEAAWNDEEDDVVIIPRDRAELFLLAIRNEVEP